MKKQIKMLLVLGLLATGNVFTSNFAPFLLYGLALHSATPDQNGRTYFISDEKMAEWISGVKSESFIIDGKIYTFDEVVSRFTGKIVPCNLIFLRDTEKGRLVGLSCEGRKLLQMFCDGGAVDPKSICQATRSDVSCAQFYASQGDGDLQNFIDSKGNIPADLKVMSCGKYRPLTDEERYQLEAFIQATFIK